MGAKQGKPASQLQLDPWACSCHLDICEPQMVKTAKSHPKSEPNKRHSHIPRRDNRVENSTPSMSGLRISSSYANSKEAMSNTIQGGNPQISSHHGPLQNDEGWTDEEDAKLESAVKYTAKCINTHVPRYEQLSKCYKDGWFIDDDACDFWHCVAIRVSSRDATACYRRYNQAHGSGVARFTVARRSNPSMKLRASNRKG
jgi:hypothetical protein